MQSGNNRNLIIALVVAGILLCCCCLGGAVITYLWFYGDALVGTASRLLPAWEVL